MLKSVYILFYFNIFYDYCFNNLILYCIMRYASYRDNDSVRKKN